MQELEAPLSITPPGSLLREHWYVACTAAELGRKKPLARTIMGEHLALFREADGRPGALFDRCLHRNAALSAGRVKDNCLACPYHGWAFDREGQVLEIPSEGPEVGVRAGRKLKAFPALEQDGLIWVWLGLEAPGERKPRAMPFYHGDHWRSYYMITPFEGDVTDLVENFMDVPHTVFVHAGWFRNPKRVQGDAVVKRTAESVEIEYLHDDSIGFAKWALNPDGQPLTHTDKFFMPNITRVDYSFGSRRHFVISSQITPVAPGQAMVYTAIAFRFGWLSALLKPFFQWYTRRVIEQDTAIMRNQTRNISRTGKAFGSTEADLVHLYIESLRAVEERGAPPPEPVERKISFWI